MKWAILLVALGALLSVGTVELLLHLVAWGGQTSSATFGAYLIALLLAVTAGILSDLAALRQRRLARAIFLALLTLLGLVSVSFTIPLAIEAAFVAFPQPDVTLAFAPLVVLPLAALSSLLPARPQPGTRDASGGTQTGIPTSSAPVANRSPRRPALLSLAAGLYTPVAVPLALVLNQLALAVMGGPVCFRNCPPVEPPASVLLMDLATGLFLLVVPVLGLALVSAHVALVRPNPQAPPTPWRTTAWWGLILGYATVPVLMALVAWAILSGAIGGE